MKNLKKTLMLLTLFAMLFATVAMAGDGAAIRLTAPETSVAPGDTFDVVVSVENNPGVAAMSFSISYDETKLAPVYTGSTYMEEITGSGMSGWTLGAAASWTVAGLEDNTANGNILTLHFKVLETATSGNAAIEVTSFSANNNEDDETLIPFDLNGCTVVVAGACEHDFSVENKDAVGALKTAGNCQAEAVYYKSCSKCEAVSTADADTFTGDKDMNNHVGTPSEWKTDSENTKHWKEYSCCSGVHVSEAAHKSTGSNAATCQHAAVCDDCEKEYGSKADHSYTAETVKPEALKSDATCTAAAVYYKSCAACGHVEKTDEAPTFTSGNPLGHDWGDWSESKAATCTDKGEESRSCKRDCGVEPQTRETDALGHDWGAWTESKAATCTDKGEESRSCKRDCGVDPQTRETDALGHGQWIDYKVVTEATCGADGVAQGECGLCHNVFDDIVIPATGEHSWDEGEVTREATTEAEGEKTFTCTVCGKTRTEPIAKLAPVATAKPAVKPHSPKTGDESHLVVWAAALLLACGGTAVVIARKKHN